MVRLRLFGVPTPENGRVLSGDCVDIDAGAAVGTPDPGAGKVVSVSGVTLTGPDPNNYAVSATPDTAAGAPLTARILTVNDGRFDDGRYTQYVEGVSDAQEPFRRALWEALLAGFGKENIRKRLQLGLVFETGLSPPAIDTIESARGHASCTPPSVGLRCSAP